MPVTLPKRFVDCIKMPTEAPLPITTDGRFRYRDLDYRAADIPALLGHSVDAALTGALRVPCAPVLAAAGAARVALSEERLGALKLVPYTTAGLVGGVGLGLTGAALGVGDAGLGLAYANLTGLKVCGSAALQGVEIAAHYTLVPVMKAVAAAAEATAKLLEEVFS
jgi:hypothetical protein